MPVVPADLQSQVPDLWAFESLLEYLIREQDFPNGVFLMTGTGIIPNSDFTLVAGDMVHISINGIGSLNNPVVQG